jgi:hypothetical protein
MSAESELYCCCIFQVTVYCIILAVVSHPILVVFSYGIAEPLLYCTVHTIQLLLNALRCCGVVYIHICTNEYLCICNISLYRIILKEMVFPSYTVMKIGTYFVCSQVWIKYVYFPQPRAKFLNLNISQI